MPLRFRLLLPALLVVAAGAALLLRSPPGASPAAPGGARGSAVWAAMTNHVPEGFQRPDAEWKLALPDDHGAHRSALMDAWSLSLHLRADDGAPFGIQISFLRVGVTPPDQQSAGSAWEIADVYRAHATFLDAGADRSLGVERFGRGFPGAVGFDPGRGELRFDDWAIVFGAGDGTAAVVTASAGDARWDLRLSPVAAPASAGGEGPFRGYAMTRLGVDGTLAIDGASRAVRGTAWLDHLWGDLPVPGQGPVAWDRLLVHLDDGTDISVARSRRIDGSGSATVEAFARDGTGEARSLDGATMEPLRTWRDARSGRAYPVRWRLGGAGIDLTVAPVADDQAHPFVVPVWSGIVTVEGEHDGAAVSGVGTLQLTGYGDGNG